MIDENGQQVGIMSLGDALRLAESKELDLVEVSPMARPPVCRIVDYGKFKYEQAKKANQAKKHASVIEIKEIKFRPKTDEHDYDFKIRHIRRFLEEGNKVRLVIAFRGREIVHPETGRAMLDRVIRECADVAHMEQMPMMDGRRMVMVVSPKPARPGAPAAAGPPGRPAGPSTTPGVPGAGPPAAAAPGPASSPASSTQGGQAPRPQAAPAQGPRPVGNRPNPPARSGS